MSDVLLFGNAPDFFFGICGDLKPALPVGFLYMESPRDFLMAVSPDGKQWMVGKSHLYRRKFYTASEAAAINAAHDGEQYFTPAKEHDAYLDDDETIQL